MRLPYSKALVWLFAEGKSEAEVAAQLDELSLPPLEKADLDSFAHEASLLPLSPGMRRRLPKKQYDRLDMIIAEKLGLAEIYCRHTGNFALYPMAQLNWEEVGKILRNPVLRIALDVGILCRYSFEELSQILPATFHEQLSEGGIDLYCKYFFNYKAMSKEDWRVYMRLCAAIPYAYVRYHAALTKPKDEALFLAGLPTRANFADFLKTVMGTAAYKFQHYSRMSTPQADGQARAWAKVGFDAGVKYEKFSASDVQDFAKTVQTEFDYIESDIPTVQPDMLSQIKPPDETLDKTKSLPEPPPDLFTDTEV